MIHQDYELNNYSEGEQDMVLLNDAFLQKPSNMTSMSSYNDKNCSPNIKKSVPKHYFKKIRQANNMTVQNTLDYR